MTTEFKTAYDDVVTQVVGGKCFAQRLADGGYCIRAQQTDHNNSRKSRVVIHVWLNSKLLRKSEVAALLEAI